MASAIPKNSTRELVVFRKFFTLKVVNITTVHMDSSREHGKHDPIEGSIKPAIIWQLRGITNSYVATLALIWSCASGHLIIYLIFTF